MKKQKRNILAIAGVISTVVGIIWTIPSFLQYNYVMGVVATLLIIGGLVILAISFGD